MAALIEARGLVKRYKGILAVAGVDFAVQEQECFGFLGPNGAGKTTIIRMLSCVYPLSEGVLLVDNRDVMKEARAIKAVIGLVPQEENLDPDLTVLQNLLVYARYFDIPKQVARRRALELLELFQLLDRQQSRIDTLSGGMKRRLLIARALLNEPKILILDEPTAGLDPQARHLVWQKLRYLKGQGVTMVLSTHNMEEAARLCDRLVIMDQGKILVQDRPADLIKQYVGQEVLELRLDARGKSHVLRQLQSYSVSIEDVGDTLYVFSKDGSSLPQQLMIEGGDVMRRQATLEDVFLRLTGRELKE
jgi:lipooligosaccharide transport system ATP-binding protein